MKRIKNFLFVFCFAFLLVGCDNNSSNLGATDDTIVYVTTSGSKYHEEDCRYLSHSSIEISLSEAIEEGYEPCSVCSPPTE